MKLLHPQGVGKNPKVGSNAGTKENAITEGGVDTPVQAFHGSIEHGSSSSLTYGAHKKPYTDNMPTDKGGRKGAKIKLRGKMY